jgi:hypothetical protein
MPFPGNTPNVIKKPKNIAKEALKVKSYLTADLSRTQTTAADEFKVTRARISQLIKIVDTLPADFITELNETEDQSMIRRFSGKRLLKIASLQSEKNRLEAIRLLNPI